MLVTCLSDKKRSKNGTCTQSVARKGTKTDTLHSVKLINVAWSPNPKSADMTDFTLTSNCIILLTSQRKALPLRLLLHRKSLMPHLRINFVLDVACQFPRWEIWITQMREYISDIHSIEGKQCYGTLTCSWKTHRFTSSLTGVLYDRYIYACWKSG